MPKLVYRGHDYVQQKEPATQTKCVELTYRHEHYNTCRAEAKSDLHQELTYRGSDYQPKQKSEEVTELDIKHDQQKVFVLTRQIVHAQFELADKDLTQRLWQEVADRKIDPDRIINLMYCCSSHEDNEALMKVDLASLEF